MLLRTFLILALQGIASQVLPLHAAEARPEVFLGLRPAAEVQGKAMRIEDLAVVTARDPAERAKWQAMEIVPPVSLAVPVRMSREEIARNLALAYPESQGRVVWGGSAEVLVTGKRQRVDLEQGINNAAAFLMEKLGGDGFVSLRLVNGSGSVEVPAGTVRSRLDTQAARKTGAYVEIPLIVEVDGVPAVRHPLRFLVSRGASSPSPEASAQAIVPVSASLPIGQAIAAPEESAKEMPLAVTKQQPVTILIDDGGVRIESEGVALANARQGEKVRVRRLNGNVELAGRAVQQGVVLVEEN